MSWVYWRSVDSVAFWRVGGERAADGKGVCVLPGEIVEFPPHIDPSTVSIFTRDASSLDFVTSPTRLTNPEEMFP